jgi:ATP-dependent Clp protease protease subunit
VVNEAVMLLQAGSKRLITPRTFLEVSELRDRVRSHTLDIQFELEQRIIPWQQQAHRIIAARSGGLLSEKTLADNTSYRRAWCVNAQEAMAAGLVDAISTEAFGAAVGATAQAPALQLQDREGQHSQSTLEERKKRAEERKQRADAEALRLDLRDLEFSSENTFTYRFFSAVDEETVSAAQAAIRRFARRGAKEITLYINSVGGSIVDGLALYDLIQQVKASGIKVNTVGLGFCASMGGALLQAGNERIMGAESWLLIHRASNWIFGTTSEIAQRAERLNRMQHEVFTILAERSQFADAKAVIEQCHDHDWLLTAQEALELGFIDRIL